MLTEKEIRQQSQSAMDQWGDQWKENAKKSGVIYRKNPERLTDLLYYGAGKTLVACATGASLEDSIESLKKYKDNVDIIANDKSFGVLMDNNIKPKFVVVADANVNYEQYCKPYLDQTNDIKLIINVTANIKWSENWKGKVYFHVNKDNIKTQDIFIDISKCQEVIPASSNVGNTMIVLASEILGYDKTLLTGYDFAWENGSNYYAYGDNDKRYYMKHMECIDAYGNFSFSSMNLVFSYKWLVNYMQFQAQKKGVVFFNCSGKGLLQFNNRNLEKMLKKSSKRKLDQNDISNIINAHKKVTVVKEGAERLKAVIENEKNVVECAVVSIPDEILYRISEGQNESKILRS